MPSVTRKTQSDRAARRDAVRRRLQDAVERLLADSSFMELSVERIVGEAEISRSTFYVYYEDKGDLLHALTQGVVRDGIRASGTWFGRPAAGGKDELRDALKRLFDHYRAHSHLVAAVVEASTYDQRLREGYESEVGDAVRSVAEHLRAGQEQGTVRADLAPDPVASWVVWMMERGLHQLVSGAKGKEVTRLLDSLTEILWNTLYEP